MDDCRAKRDLSSLRPPIPLARPIRHRDTGPELGIGLGVFFGGYLMGSLIVIGPALFTNKGQDPVENTGEKRLALIPVVGPMVWWFTARSRLDRSRDDYGFNSGFHNVLGLPYAVIATAAQGIGVGLMIYAVARSSEEVASSTALVPVAKSKPKVTLSPTPGGLSLQGVF